MKYEAPELEVIELDEADIIQTSPVTPGGAAGENEGLFDEFSLDANVN